MKMIAGTLAAALLLGGTGFAAAAQADQTVPSTPPAAKPFSDQQILGYAAALAELNRLNSAVAAQQPTLPPADQPAFAQQVDAQRLAILTRNGLDATTFNAISKAVEDDPALRDRARQAMMDKLLGS
jgi:hypothetical protein